MPADDTATTAAMARRGNDPARLAVRAAVATAGMTLKQASRALGRNDAYLQQYLYRGTPRRLPEPLRLRLAEITGADQADFLDPALRALRSPAGGGEDGTVRVPLHAVRAAAGGGSVPDEASGSHDSQRRMPSPPGIFILDDGVGLVAKRVDAIPNSWPLALRLSSDNPAYSNYRRRVDEVHIVGRVVWFARSI